MSKKNMNGAPGMENDAGMPSKKKKKKGSGLLGRIIRRFFLVLFTVIILAVAALVLVLSTVVLTAVLYDQFAGQIRRELQVEAAYIAHGLELEGAVLVHRDHRGLGARLFFL